MAFAKVTKVGMGVAALGVLSMAAIRSVPAPTHTPTVTVHHNPG